MSEIPMEHWDFIPGKVHYENRSKGKLPHLRIVVTCNGVRRGELEIHMHHNKHGNSYGITIIDYEEPEPMIGEHEHV